MSKRRYRSGGLTTEEMRHSEDEMTKGETRAEFDCFFSGEHRLLESVGIGADDREGIVRIWILLIEVDRAQSGIQAFALVRLGIIGPFVRNEPGARPCPPDVSFG